MLELFTPLKELLLIEPIRIDNLVFRLHSRLTVLLLIVCAILVTAKQLVGDPISCITDSNGFGIYVGFLVAKLRPQGSVKHWRKMKSFITGTISGFVLQVCIVLALQATTFYAPQALWQAWEGGIVSYLAQDLASPFVRDSWTNEHRNRILSYFSHSLAQGHNIYAIRFFVCELLNFLNTMYLLNIFLEGEFSRYGFAVMGLTSETKPFERIDPMARLFPKLTKCTIHTFGPGGSSQTHDALCVLPLNVVNEKIFIMLWFWLIFLATVGALALVYRVAVLTQSWLRIILVRASIPGLSRMTAIRLVRNLSFGDWFLLHRLSKNTNPLILLQLVHDLTDDYAKVDV